MHAVAFPMNIILSLGKSLFIFICNSEHVVIVEEMKRKNEMEQNFNA